MADIVSQESVMVLPPSSNFRHTRSVLIVCYLLAAVWGMRNIWYWERSGLDFFVPLALMITLGWWAVVDAKRRGHSIPMFVPWFILMAPILVPGCVIWSRRWPGVGWIALHIALWYALATIAMHVGGLLVFGEDWLQAFDL